MGFKRKHYSALLVFYLLMKELSKVYHGICSILSKDWLFTLKQIKSLQDFCENPA